jgi:hypothetical protein
MATAARNRGMGPQGDGHPARTNATAMDQTPRARDCWHPLGQRAVEREKRRIEEWLWHYCPRSTA